MKRVRRFQYLGNTICVLLLFLFVVPFAFYALERGTSATSATEQAHSRFVHVDAPFATAVVYAHMVSGAIITALAPLQLLAAVRARWPRIHRVGGYLTAFLASMTALLGLFYILLKGTIGGAAMSIGFGLYGVLMLFCALKTVMLARSRDPAHRDWAIRLVILAVASWLYRVHYGVWELLTESAGTSADFTGPFDRVQVVAFYLPYLALFEVWRRRNRKIL